MRVLTFIIFYTFHTGHVEIHLFHITILYIICLNVHYLFYTYVPYIQLQVGISYYIHFLYKILLLFVVTLYIVILYYIII